MAVKDQAALRAALESGDFDQLLGTLEDDWIDFKRDPYRLESPRERWEFAKDVTSFANVGGGCIVIGVKTSRNANELGERAASHSLVPKRMVNWDKHVTTLADMIYPEIRGVRAHWFPDDPAADRGLLLIVVPGQDEQEKPFILRNMILNEGDEPTRALGIPSRMGERTSWIKAERLHQFIDQATRGRHVSPDGQPTSQAEKADRRIAGVVATQQWADVPTYFLQAYPRRPSGVLRDIHSEEGFKGAMFRPPSLRSMGFNLDLRQYPDAYDGGLAYFADPRRAIVLDRDGLYTVAGVFTEQWLGWNQRRREGALVVHPVVLVEFTFEFFRFVHQTLIPRSGVRDWVFRVEAQGLKTRGGGVRLAPGRPDPYMDDLNAVDASTDFFAEEVQPTGSAARDTFAVLEVVYGYFGLPPEKIPFTEDGAVSEAAILRIR